MRLRYLFMLTFCIVALVPMMLFWAWPFSKALESELDDVKERHLVIAKNLAGAFERYYKDVTGVFVMLNDDIKDEKSIKTLFSSYGYHSVMEVDKRGKVIKCYFSNDSECEKEITPNILKLALNTLTKDKTTLSTVTEEKSINIGPMLLAVKEKDQNFILAYLSTDYILSMGKKVAFGKKGHAVVIDQEGNVMSHPLDAWIKSRKNISKISVVQKMIEGKTGVGIFYSPAFKDDMVAGYTVVKNANWGVMVPQPLSELKNKAKEIDETAMFVMFLSVLLALLITIPISFLLIRPLEKLSQIIKSIDKGDLETNLEFNTSKFLPLEIKKLKNSFIKMMNTLNENKKEISHLAYIDTNTGLPNRNYFHELVNNSLQEMKKSNEKGALVFIDFDGFKKINDTYGHRTGDDLLFLFAKRIMRHFSLLVDSKDLFLFDENTLLEVIPARLGGDEFVILFRNIENESEIKQKIEKLFKDIFSEYAIGNIKIRLEGSAGIAMFPKDGKQYDEMLRSADLAMYAAKTSGKSTIKFYENINNI